MSNEAHTTPPVDYSRSAPPPAHIGRPEPDPPRAAETNARLEALGRLSGGVVHDFNNLLTVILSYADLLKTEGDLGDQARADVDNIMAAARHAADLTRQLLAFGKRRTSEPRFVDVRDLVSNVTTLLARVVAPNIRFGVELSARPATVRADPALLEQVVVNLVVNAEDSMPDGGDLTVSVRGERAASDGLAAAGHVVIEVRDTGIGMDETTRAHIFEPYYTTKAETHGTGLGLATVQDIVESLGGVIGVDSESGLGTTFRVTLPAASAADVAPSSRPSPDGSVAGGSERLLLVVTSAPLRHAAHRTLARHGFSVTVAATPEEALERLSTRGAAFDLIVTDLVMPGTSGVELLAKARELRPAVQCLYVCGSEGASSVRRRGLPRDELVLSMPFGGRDLVRKVRQVLKSELPESTRNAQ